MFGASSTGMVRTASVADALRAHRRGRHEWQRASEPPFAVSVALKQACLHTGA